MMLIRERGAWSGEQGAGKTSGEQGLWMKIQDYSGLKKLILYFAVD
jgi:hypothetical protein